MLPAGTCEGTEEDMSEASRPTYGLDVKAPGWLQGPPGPPVPEDLQVKLFPLDEQHPLGDPAEEEDLGEGLGQRFVPEVLHVHGFEAGEHVVAAVMLEAQGGGAGCGAALVPLRQHQGQGLRGHLHTLIHAPLAPSSQTRHSIICSALRARPVRKPLHGTGMCKKFVLEELEEEKKQQHAAKKNEQKKKTNMQVRLKFRQICKVTQLGDKSASATSVRVLWAYFEPQKRRGEDLCCV